MRHRRGAPQVRDVSNQQLRSTTHGHDAELRWRLVASSPGKAAACCVDLGELSRVDDASFQSAKRGSDVDEDARLHMLQGPRIT